MIKNNYLSIINITPINANDIDTNRNLDIFSFKNIIDKIIIK